MNKKNIVDTFPEKAVLETIRKAERFSHTRQYEREELFGNGSWLQKPVKTITDLYPFFEQYSWIDILDLGCGIGRSCIPFVCHFRNKCKAEAVDILDIAVEKLLFNCRKYGIEKDVAGAIMPLEACPVRKKVFDLIIAVSALEHVESKEAFICTLEKIKSGLKDNGIFCMIMNTEMTEFDAETGCYSPPQFELNLKTEETRRHLHRIFTQFSILKETVKKQEYEILRESGPLQLTTQVVTFVAANVKTQETDGKSPAVGSGYFIGGIKEERHRMEKTFKQRYLAGEISFEEIDDYVDTWNNSEEPCTLREFLGLNAEEEDVWIEDSDEALQDLLDKQKKEGGV